MRAVKPVRLCMLTRTLELGRQPHLIVSVIAMTPFSGERQVLGEIPMWKLFEERAGGVIVDECHSKPAGEVLVFGNFHAPGGAPVPVSFVGVDVTRGDKQLVSKKVAVIGDRFWSASVPSNPTPLGTLPIGWQHAFGGPNFAQNPLGKGLKPEGDGPWALPNLEDPEHLVKSQGDKPKPACFGPLDLGSVARRELAGNYGGDYLTTRFPGPAADMDPRFFHMAPEDQRITGFFQGGETFTVHNMHPDKPLLQGKLTSLQGRAFIERKRPNGEVVFEEVPLRADTVVLFPEDEAIVTVFRGMVPVTEDDSSDVLALVIAGEDESLPRPASHYLSVLRARTDREHHGALVSLKDEDLMPQREAGWGAARMPEDDMMQMTKIEGIMERRTRKLLERQREEQRAAIAAMGLDPDDLLPPPDMEAPPPLDDFDAMIAYVDKLTAKAEADRKNAEERVAKISEQARASFAAAGMDWDAEVEKALKASAGPPKFRAEQELERMREQCQLARNADMPWEDVEAMIAEPAYFAALKQQEQLLLDGYRAGAAFKHSAERLSSEESRPLREQVLAAHAAKKKLENFDLTGADLSGLDLSGVELPGALMEAADLSGTRLDGADLTRAVLVRAKLTGASLVGAKLDEASLGDTTFDGVDLSKATLRKAWLVRARLEEASLVDADLGEAICFEARFGKVDLSGANLEAVALHKADLRGGRFVGTRFKKTQVIACDWSGCDLSRAQFERSTWVGSQLDGADLSGADMKETAWAQGVSAKGANFFEANLVRCSLRDSSLVGANFTRATLSVCDMGNVDLTDGTLYECDARGSMFIRANLTRVNARGGSFMEAILKNSQLAGADFSKANLFRAMLSRARGDDQTRFTGANLDFVLKEPLYKEPPRG